VERKKLHTVWHLLFFLRACTQTKKSVYSKYT
jgi:hypothetical protein